MTALVLLDRPVPQELHPVDEDRRRVVQVERLPELQVPVDLFLCRSVSRSFVKRGTSSFNSFERPIRDARSRFGDRSSRRRCISRNFP